MDTLLNLLYYGQINEADKSPKPQTPDKELQTYDILYESLNDEQKKLFTQWQKMYADRLEVRVEFAFERGFKLGFHLAEEIKKFDV